MSERRHVMPLPLGDEIPFSKGLMARALVVTGLDPERSYLIAHRADRDLAERGVSTLDLDRLAELAADVIGDEHAATHGRSSQAAERAAAARATPAPARRRRDRHRKSTIATEAAHRLGITRVTSTDFIRQTMRAFFSEEFMPSVHYSSFEARLALDARRGGGVGRRRDSRLPRPDEERRRRRPGRARACGDRALVARARGSASRPGMIATEFPGAFVVQCVVAIEDENLHRGHFWVRDYATEGLRPAREVPGRAAADPADPGLPRGAGATLRRAGHRQRLARQGDRGRHGSRAATRRPARQRP